MPIDYGIIGKHIFCVMFKTVRAKSGGTFRSLLCSNLVRKKTKSMGINLLLQFAGNMH